MKFITLKYNKNNFTKTYKIKYNNFLTNIDKSRRFVCAPMVGLTNSHCRYFYRLFTKKSLLFSEMVTVNAINNSNDKKFLNYNKEENPLAIQLGGSNPKELLKSALIAEKLGYNEVNLNLGCPSNKVQLGKFGAYLMAYPKLVTECIKIMQNSISIPVTIKCRVGIDFYDDKVDLINFIENIIESGIKSIYIHARKAWLNGLSPKENRNIPPLNYNLVYQVKKKFPNIQIIINGEINNLDKAKIHLHHVDGVMVGRSVYYNPWILSKVDEKIFNKSKNRLTRYDIANIMIDYIDNCLVNDKINAVKIHHITKHMMYLFHGINGSSQYKRFLSVESNKPNAKLEVLVKALTFVDK